jgi:hypothetical protein
VVVFHRVILGVLLGVVAAASPARAQLPLQMAGEQPGPLVREAFASAYGQALADGLGKALRDSADSACLNSKKIAAADLRQRGLELMTKWGTRMLEQSATLIDAKAYDDKLSAAGGRNASAELARLKEDADVKRYREIERPIRLTAVLDLVFEQFDHYATVARIKIDPVSPLASGDDALLNKDPTEASEKELKEFTASHQSQALKRFLKLSEDAADATSAAIRTDQLPNVGPQAFFHGVETDLAELCVR